MALVVAGEACPAEVVDRWAPGRVMINAYGPTETTVYAAMSAPLSTGVGGAADRVAGGRRRRCLCWMGGCGRCRRGWSASCMWPAAAWRVGMCGRAGLTASRFVACPFAARGRQGHACIAPGIWCVGGADGQLVSGARR